MSRVVLPALVVDGLLTIVARSTVAPLMSSGQAVARPSEVDQRRQTMATAEAQGFWSQTRAGLSSQVANRRDHIYDYCWRRADRLSLWRDARSCVALQTLKLPPKLEILKLQLLGLVETLAGLRAGPNKEDAQREEDDADVARQAFATRAPKSAAKMAVGPAMKLVTTSHVHGCRKKDSTYPPLGLVLQPHFAEVACPLREPRSEARHGDRTRADPRLGSRVGGVVRAVGAAVWSR